MRFAREQKRSAAGADSMGITHDRAIIISSGDEIITGQLLDTNARWIADRLVCVGVLPIEHISIPDVLETLSDTILRAAERAPLVIMTGGLGPTEGDLTRQALAAAMGDALAEDAEARAAIEQLLAARGRPMTDRQARQALRPSRAVCLPNTIGTAPGLHARISSARQSADVYCLPGPPGELRPMFLAAVEPALAPPSDRTVRTRLLHVVGVSEADCVDRLGDLTRRDQSPLVGVTASGGILTIRARYEGAAPADQADAKLEEVERRVRAQLGHHVFIHSHEQGIRSLAACVLDRMKATGRVFGSVESCTGGMLGEIVTGIPGASAAYIGGFQTYSNQVKIGIGVDAALLAMHGAVSREVADAMAAAGLRRLIPAGGDGACVSITGIAGPDGGTPTRPVGTVHIGLAVRESGRERVHSRRFRFSGDREDIRQRSCTTALAMLHFWLSGVPMGEPRLLWEVEDTESAGSR